MDVKINDLVSSDYIPLLAEYHESGHGIGGEHRAGRVLELMTIIDSHSLLDYGCGQGTLIKALCDRTEGCKFAEYDPGVFGKDALPDGKFDMVVSTDVFEHIEPDKLDNVLQHIDLLAVKCVYLIISTIKASLNLADGRNAHLIVKPGTWWLKQIKSAFPAVAVSVDRSNDNEIAILIDKTKPSDSTQKIEPVHVKGQYPARVVNDADFYDLWHGQQCLIIGSGKTKDYLPFNPELNSFQGKIIGCNSAFSVGYRTDMIMFIDEKVIEKYGGDMAAIDCFKLSIACDPPARRACDPPAPWDLHGNDIRWLLARQPERFSRSFDSGLYPADLTGYLALNTALLMGCNPVWLYGFDSFEHQYSSKMDRFNLAAQWANQNGIEIYVADKDSFFCKKDTPIFEYKPLPAGEDNSLNPLEEG